jgi:hypothetical protein
MITRLFSLLSVLLALIAAGFWAKSTSVSLPVIEPTYSAMLNIEPFYAALKNVAQFNAIAAISAFASATAQAISIYFTPVCLCH